MTTEIWGAFGDDTLFGTSGSDIIYGDPEGGTGGGDCEADHFESNGHAISNIVLYVEVDGEIVKVKLDNFVDDYAFDADDLSLAELIADLYGEDADIVAATVKAGANFSGMGPGEGTLWIIDGSYDASSLPVGKADVTYQYDILDSYEKSCDHDGGQPGNDTIDGGAGADIIFGGGGDDVLYGDTLFDFPAMPHAISNVVLYLQDDAGDILKVKFDSFSDSETDVFDANDLNFQAFIDANYDGMDMVALTIKAGNNKSGMGPGEGELFVLDDSVGIEDLQAAGGSKGQADATYDYVADLEPLGAPDEGDVLVGGTGDDLLYGGVGADTFVFADGDGHDTIGDFEVGEDSIDLSGVSGMGSFADVIAAASNDGADAVIDLGDGSVTLVGVQVEELSASDFAFA